MNPAQHYDLREGDNERRSQEWHYYMPPRHE
ncbi:hypothetical protein HNQ77_000812 [Silvibacterium bohemicum]|uniref:Uncharacterized protein n=1 Tax=Silvibacterium bohemicum TaxID=1577686 RepID=A0A841JWP8_9BACT|nr:hypothetical protein [Silvibacterium bohemicum]